MNYCHGPHKALCRPRRGRASEFYELAPPRIRCAVAGSTRSALRIRGGGETATDMHGYWCFQREETLRLPSAYRDRGSRSESIGFRLAFHL
jgi:hypothetical protein